MSGSQMPVALLEWKAVRKNTLRGFAKVRLGRSMSIKDIATHVKNGRRWVQLPAKPIINQDGTAKKDDAGKILYVPVIEWTDREAADRFSQAVIEAIDREYPGDTDE